MKRKYLAVSVLFSLVVFFLIQRQTYGYGVMTDRNFIMFSGQVLGKDDNNNIYTYIIKSASLRSQRRIPSLTPTLTPVPTTPSPSTTPRPSATPTPSSTPTPIPSLTPYPTRYLSPTIPHPTSTPKVILTATPIPTATPTVVKTYRPARWPTATPIFPSPTQFPVHQSPIPTDRIEQQPSPTNIVIQEPTPQDNIDIPFPTSTPILPQFRGIKSTIVIEMPQPTINPLVPYSRPPTPVTRIIKGEDVKVISINLPSTEKAAVIDTPEKPAGSLDITLEEKQGGTLAVSQQEFVIQKGVQAVTVSTNEQNSRDLTIQQDDTKARTTMSLSVNPSTNILAVDTPAGPMKVSIMPGDAMAIMRQLKVVDQTGIPRDILLEVRDKQLQYKILADKTEKLFWVIPINIPRELYVAADTGGLIEIKKSSLYNFLSLFTF